MERSGIARIRLLSQTETAESVKQIRRLQRD